MSSDPPRPAFVVRAGDASDVDSLEPLWLSVHRQHRDSMPELAPYVDDHATWRERRRLYVDLLSKDDSILLLATVDEELVGYGLAHVLVATDTWIADTWLTGQRVGEIESLAVLPGFRGAGIGSALLDELRAGLEAQGVIDLVLGVLPGNRAAIRLYERHGFRMTWSYMSRFQNR